MSTTPLILDAGVFKIGSTDFSDAITSATLQATADEVAIPQTLSTPKSSRKGGVKYEVVLKYLSNDISDSAELFRVFWDAIRTGSGLLVYTIQMHPGALSPTNPGWTGTFSVLAAQLGGDVASLSEGTGTFPCTGEPTELTA